MQRTTGPVVWGNYSSGKVLGSSPSMRVLCVKWKGPQKVKYYSCFLVPFIRYC